MMYQMFIYCIIILSIQHVSAEIKWLAVPQHTVVLIGQDLVLNCSAEDTDGAQLSYRWQFNESVVPDRHSLFLNHSLLIPRVTSDDLGQYRCIVKTTTGPEVISPEATVIEAFIDQFLIYPRSFRTIEGETIVFECVTGKSAPKAEVYWELNGAKFGGGEQLLASFGDYDPTRLTMQYSMKLQIIARRSESGTFRCVSVNPLLKKTVWSEDASLYVDNKVVQPNLITIFPPNHIVATGIAFTMNCDHTGYPAPTVSWFHDGVELANTSRIYLHPNGSMTFKSISLDDAGMYYCLIVNRIGRAKSTSTNLTVATLGISFVQEPNSSTVFAGQSETLECIPPISIPPATVTWYKDYQPLKLRTGDMSVSVVNTIPGNWDLHFSSVQRSDDGIYFCVAINNYSIPTSRTSRQAVLTVTGSPSIIEPPSNQRIIKGRLLQLTCKVDGNPTPTIEWLFSNLPLRITSKITFRNGVEELNIGDIGKAEEGIYTCLTKNSYGQKRADAYVKVIVPPVNTKSLGYIVYNLYQTAILPCDIYSDPSPNIQWYKDDKQLVSPQLSTANSLIIINVTTANEGNYSCHGENEAGIVWSNGTLKIQVPPKITDGPLHQTVLIGQSARLPCKIIGYPNPTVTWLLNGTTIDGNYPGGVVLTSGGQYLDINLVTWQHVGVYTCIANSSQGSDQQSAFLHINVPAHVERILGSNIVLIKQEVNLRCGAQGTPPPVVQWIHNGQIIQPTPNGRISFPSPFTIRIKFASLQDAGPITCNASNNIGSSQKSVHIYIIDTPKPPILAGIYPISKSSIRLTWVIVPQLQYTNNTYYRIYYKQRLKENFKLYPEQLSPTLTNYEIPNLEAGKEYVFSMAGENEAGVGTMSSPLSAFTFDSGPSEPRAFRVVKIEPRTLTVSWEIPEIKNGDIRKYELQYRQKDSITQEMKSVNVFSPSIPTQMLHIDDLLPNTIYQVQVRAANIQDGQDIWGTFSTMLDIKTQIAVPVSSPSEVKTVVLTSTTVSLQWKHLPANETNGPILAYIISYNSSNDQSEKRVQGDTESTNIDSLSPWTKYSFTIKAENEAGTSPISLPAIATTYAAVPSAPPMNIKAEAISSDMIQITWQPPPVSTWNSQLNGHKVQYRVTGTIDWQEKVLDDINQRSIILSNLFIWKEYDIRLAVYTLQVVPGVGPYSTIITTKTLQAASGPIGNISYIATNNSILLSWQPPEELNGVVLYYVLKYHSRNSSELNETSIKVYESNKTVYNLESNTVYDISIGTVNKAGPGPSVSTIITTLPNNQINTDYDNIATDSTSDTPSPVDGSTIGFVQDSGNDNQPTKNIPVIVGGSLTAGLFVLFIIILIIYKCVKKRRSDRDNYVIPFAYKSKRFSSITERDENGSNSTVNTQQTDIPTTNNSQSQYSKYGSVVPEDNITQTTQYDSQVPDLVVTPPFSSTSKSNNLSKRPESFHGDSIAGLDNPNYFEDEVFSATLPRPHSTSTMTSDELYSQMGKKLKKNRMKSGSAAAIAVMRNSTLSISANDTDSLVHNDSIVIYNERTML
ncbi:cell adhesion molecule DSCAML1 isoform X1 [Patella vulgata]|uniref:cell adhesion molecule DSCAML1 isoform X1 n=2 Tax=Patella vulgata TaxID=6465 RepID=UPI0024A8386E|nr:cell adhesion molecule DSCAML1 isoform X1 [Patella vulgata]